MKSWVIFKRFKEGLNKNEVVWFLEDYEAVRDGQKGHNQHPEVNSHIDIIQKALEEPDIVNFDKDYPKRRCYYSKFKDDGLYPSGYMKVVTQHMWYGKIRVVTAHFRYSVGKGEKKIYEKR